MQFYMLLGSNPNVSGLEGAYLEYLTFPMEVFDPDHEEGYGTRNLNTMEEVHDWANRYFDGDYELVLIDTTHATPVKEEA